MKQVHVSCTTYKIIDLGREASTKDRFSAADPSDHIGRPDWPKDDQFQRQSCEDDAINLDAHGQEIGHRLKTYNIS